MAGGINASAAENEDDDDDENASPPPALKTIKQPKLHEATPTPGRRLDMNFVDHWRSKNGTGKKDEARSFFSQEIRDRIDEGVARHEHNRHKNGVEWLRGLFPAETKTFTNKQLSTQIDQARHRLKRAREKLAGEESEASLEQEREEVEALLQKLGVWHLDSLSWAEGLVI
ncbi:hypothetical protein OIV83_004210 [Microbotryomycetes sp. JL201]|nr:hypothetical protein OIV83_004210 [Microbotryomycetes sp. JL201]